MLSLHPVFAFFVVVVPFFVFGIYEYYILSVGPFIVWMYLVGSGIDYLRSKSTDLLFIFIILVPFLNLILLDLSKFYYFSTPYLNAISFVCLFIAIIKVSKKIVDCEEEFGFCSFKYFATFLMLWFFPIGLVFVQKRVRNVASSERSNEGQRT